MWNDRPTTQDTFHVLPKTFGLGWDLAFGLARLTLFFIHGLTVWDLTRIASVIAPGNTAQGLGFTLYAALFGRASL